MSLRSKFASGSGWMAIGATADYAVQFVVFTMLARLVSVTELGIVAFGLVLTDIGRIFVNGGRAESIVRHGVWDDGFAGAAFTRTMAFAILLAAILAGPVSWAVDRYYAAGSGWPTAALSLIFVIEALRSIHGAKLRREFQYKQLAQRMIVGTVLSGSIAVVLAMNGSGVWALVIQRLVQQVVTTLLTLRAAKWRPVLRWHDRTLTELSQFSRRVTGTRALDVANQRMPDFLIGLALGPVPVALYRVGARSLEVIMRVTVQPFQDASLSALSRVGSPEAIGGALLRVLRAAALVIFPIYVGAAVLGTEMTVLLFGEKYAESGEVMSALAFGGLASTLLLVVGSAYLASGHAQASLRANIALVVASAILILIGGHFAGTLGAAIAVSAAQWLIVPLHLYMLRRYLGITPLRLLGGLSRPFLAALAMALPLIVLQHTLLADQSLLVRLAALVPAGGVAYLLALLAFGRGYLRDLIAEVRPMLPAKIARRLPGGKHTD